MDHLQPGSARCMHVTGRKGGPKNGNATAVRTQETHGRARQGRLARAVLPDYGVDEPCLKGNGNVVDCGEFVKTNRDVVDGDCGGPGRSTVAGPSLGLFLIDSDHKRPTRDVGLRLLDRGQYGLDFFEDGRIA